MRVSRSTFDSLVGRWDIQRTIHSSHQDLLGSFSGKAVYTKKSDSLLHYREQGVLEQGSCETCAFREYYFCYDGEIKVYFDSDLTRFFHKIEEEEATHHCGQDVYTIAYTFISDREYRTEVVVKGPRKDYLIRSLLQKEKYKGA